MRLVFFSFGMKKLLVRAIKNCDGYNEKTMKGLRDSQGAKFL